MAELVVDPCRRGFLGQLLPFVSPLIPPRPLMPTESSTTIKTAFSVGIQRRVELISRDEDGGSATAAADEPEPALVLTVLTALVPATARVSTTAAAVVVVDVFRVTREAIMLFFLNDRQKHSNNHK